LLPHLKNNADVQLLWLMSATGLNAKMKAEKFGFTYCTTDLKQVLDDPAIDALFIGTRHSTHADFTIQALEGGKHVFVEKPMVVSEEQMDAVTNAYERANARQPTGLMVGLNRRFAPMVTRLKEIFDPKDSLQMIYRVNSGPIPTSTWLHEAPEGAGMLVGEMSHFVDLMQFICGQRPARVFASALSLNSEKFFDQDNLSIVISFDGGSVGTLCYNTVGNNKIGKERLEVYGEYTTIETQEMDFVLYRVGLDAPTRTEDYRDVAPEMKLGFAEADRLFVDAILGNGTPPVTALDGFRAVELACACYQSVDEKRRIAVGQ
jgi:predicted dehydrogenase